MTQQTSCWIRSNENTFLIPPQTNSCPSRFGCNSISWEVKTLLTNPQFTCNTVTHSPAEPGPGLPTQYLPIPPLQHLVVKLSPFYVFCVLKIGSNCKSGRTSAVIDGVNMRQYSTAHSVLVAEMFEWLSFVLLQITVRGHFSRVWAGLAWAWHLA